MLLPKGRGIYPVAAATVCISISAWVTSKLGIQQGLIALTVLSVWAVIIRVFWLLWTRSYVIMGLYRPWVIKLWTKIPILGQILTRPQILFTFEPVLLLEIVLIVLNIPYTAATGGNVAEKISDVFAPGSLLFVVLIVAIASMLDYRALGYLFRYEQTEYFRQTRRPMAQVLDDKGVWAEFLAYVLLDINLREKRFIINPIIPKVEGDGFTELDLICITQDTITVVEAKNRGGRMMGEIHDYNWIQQIGRQSNKMENPFLQNQNHVIALYNYLVHGECVQRLAHQPNTMKRIYQYNYRNVVFSADHTASLNVQGVLAANMCFLYTDDVASYTRSLNSGLHTPEMDAVANYLLPAAVKFSPQEREFLFWYREVLRQGIEPAGKTCYYITTIRDNIRNTEQHMLMRYNDLGIAEWTEGGFWGPPRNGNEIIGPWNPMTQTTTSFGLAKSRYDELRRQSR